MNMELKDKHYDLTFNSFSSKESELFHVKALSEELST